MKVEKQSDRWILTGETREDLEFLREQYSKGAPAACVHIPRKCSLPIPSAMGFTNYEETMRSHKTANTCPFQCIWNNKPACARWGSATPLLQFNKACTFSDLETCPLIDYPNEPLRMFWAVWLFKGGKIHSVKQLC